jgi:hypothetical protein
VKNLYGIAISDASAVAVGITMVMWISNVLLLMMLTVVVKKMTREILLLMMMAMIVVC